MKCRSRNKAWLGAAISAATQIASAGINYFQQRKANRKKLQQQYISDSLEMQNNIGENANNDLNNYYDRVELIPQFPYGGNTNLKPNVVRGGRAIDLGNNLYLMSGRKHSQGGIDIGKNPKTGIEVEGNEVVQTTPSSLRVFSAQPILGGISPAQYILGGANPNKVFAAQENWKRINRINDDGTKYITGGKIDKNNFKTVLNKKNEEKFQNWYKNVSTILNIDSDPDNPFHAYDYRGYWLENRNKDIDYTQPDFHFTDKYKQPTHETFSIESQYAKKKYGINPKSVGRWDGENFIPGKFNDLMSINRINDDTNNSSEYIPSENIINYIKSTEGFRDKWYQDGKGIWTVGYGFTGSKVRKMFPNGMTREQADKYLADSLNIRKQILQRDTPNWDSLNQNQRDALLSYHYNIGESNYRNKSPKMQQALKDKNWDIVSENIDAGYNDKRNPGLRKRRDYERNLFNTPVEYEYGGIHIKPSKRGTFTAAAKEHGMGVQAFASKVLANKDDYSPAMVKKANFARNASKWNHKEFGGNMDFNYIIGKNNIYKLGGRRKAPTGLGIYFPTTQDLHRGILYDRDGNPLFDTEINPSSVVADRVPARNINGILYDENGNAKFDTDIEPSIVVADRVNKTPDLTSANKENDDYMANLNLDDDINIPNTSLNLDTSLKVNPMRYKQRNRGYKSKDLKGDKVTFDRNEENRVVNPDGKIGSDEIGLGINLLGNLASSLINRATINSLDYGNAPTPLRAVKLKTRYNINPQLDNIREQVARGENDVTQNTASSKTALSRRQSLRGRGLQYANQLEGQKENIETELINRDRFNQQQVGNRNIERFNSWYRGLVDFENNRRNLKAENAVAGINNAADAIAGHQGYMAHRERRLDNDMKLRRDLLDLKVLSLLNPNAKGILDPEMKKAFDEYERLLRRRRGTII